MVRLRYMSWLDEQIAKRDDLRSREALLTEHAPKIYADLWERLTKILDEAKVKLPDLKFRRTGSNGERQIAGGTPGIPMDERTFDYKLSPDERSITAAISGRPSGKLFTFAIGIIDEGIVGLKLNDETIHPQDAAQLLMGLFLFPDLR